MNFKFGLGLALCLGLLTACEGTNSIKGTLYAAKDFSFVDKDGKSQTLAGQKSYDATLNMSSSGSTLEVSTGLFSSETLALPKPTQDATGAFTVSASDSKQSFDSSGDVLVSDQTQDASTYESCVFSYQTELVCSQREGIKPIVADRDDGHGNHGGGQPGGSPHDPIPGGPGGGGGHDGDNHNGPDRDGRDNQPVCSYVQVPQYGRQYVNQTVDVTTKSASVAFNEAGTQNQIANFSGSYQLSSNLVSRSYQGGCNP